MYMRVKASATQSIRNAVNLTLSQLNEAVAQRDAWNVKIMQLQQDLRKLQIAAHQDVMVSNYEKAQEGIIGLSEAIRTVMRRSGQPMTAADVKLALAVTGFDLDRFKNSSAAVHNTLIRMTKAGELQYTPASQMYRLGNWYWDTVSSLSARRK
jgi:hypothetical protein